MTPFAGAASRSLNELLGSVPAVRDGHVDAIHDARVATRRLRALLPIALSGCDQVYIDHCLVLLRDAGRLLGRARDVDVAMEQLNSVEARLPSAGGAIADIRAELAPQQAKRRRRLVKGLDALDLTNTELLSRSGVPAAVVRARERNVRAAAATAITEQAERVRNAVVHASGIYMPNRAHALRIDTKMLRYLLEPLADNRHARRAIKSLKRVQELLGTLHDRQGLIDLVNSRKSTESGRAAIRALAEQDCRDLFRSYVEKREDVVRACDYATGAIEPRQRGTTIVAVAALAIPPVVWLLRPERKQDGLAKAATIRTVRQTIPEEQAHESVQHDLVSLK